MTEHVKIYGVTPRIQYTADGTSLSYEFPFAIFKTSDIDVYFADIKQAPSSYTVSEARHSDGGSVTFESAPSSGTIITIVRNLSIERTSDFQEGSTLRAKVLNDEFDYQIACQQQIAENLNRSMSLPPYAAGEIDLTLPEPKAGKSIVWNATGTALENSTIEVNALESTLKNYRDVAETKATEAYEQAGIATSKATIATAAAQEATTKATEASLAVDGFNHSCSNCIIAIPQNINLTLAGGTLTLHSGSILTKPNGTQYQTTEDKTLSNPNYSGTGSGIICCTSSNFIPEFHPFSKVTSGSSFPENPVANALHYNTTNSKIYLYNSTQSEWLEKDCSLPIAIVTVTSGVFTAVNQLFNGAGYIGHHAFVLPEIYGFEGSGFNADGTLKSIQRRTNNLYVVEMQSGQSVSGVNRRIGIMTSSGVLQRYSYYKEFNTRSEAPLGTAFRYCYIKDENKILFCTSNNGTIYPCHDVMLIEYNYDGNNVNLFNISPVRAMATQKELNTKAGLADNNSFTGINTVPTPSSGDNSQQIANTAWIRSEMPSFPDYANATSLSNSTTTEEIYTTTSNGWFIGKVNSSNNMKITIDDLVVFNHSYSNSQTNYPFCYPVKNGTTIKYLGCADVYFVSCS